jgi:hypothetical protein
MGLGICSPNTHVDPFNSPSIGQSMSCWKKMSAFLDYQRSTDCLSGDGVIPVTRHREPYPRTVSGSKLFCRPALGKQV